MRCSSNKKAISLPYILKILFFALAVTVHLHSDFVLASSLNSIDTSNGFLPREEAIDFHTRSGRHVYPGDTLLLYPKRALDNGVIVNYPPEQRYEIHIINGREYTTFVFPGGITTDDTSGVMLPIKLFVGIKGGVHLTWKMFALQVDTSNDHLLRLMDIHEMIRRLSAPTIVLKGAMVEQAGCLQLKKNNYEGARKYYQEAIVLDSSRASTFYYNISCTYARENKPTEALQWLRRAFDTGFDQYLHALKNDSDLVSIRSLSEFKEIVTSPLVRKRMKLSEVIDKNPLAANTEYLRLCQSYLKQLDIDSFYISFAAMVKNGHFPNISSFDEDDSIFTRDPRIQKLFEQYTTQNKDKLFYDYWAWMNPYVITRLENSTGFKEISKCNNLVELRITPKGIVNLTSEVAQLEHLKTLRFIDCGFTSILDTITRFTNLDTLSSDRGETTTLPNKFSNLVHLKQLALHNGLLEYLPQSFGTLLQLTDLSLDANSFSVIPDVLFHLTSLEKLEISDNRLSTISEDIGRLKKLTRLDLSLNNLTVLPEEIGSLSQLTYLDLSFNELHKIPRSIRNLLSLQTLIVFGNRLNKNELDTLRKLLPQCTIYNKEQNVSKSTAARNRKTYSHKSMKLSFRYPAHYSLITKKETDSTKIVISLTQQKYLKKKSSTSWKASSSTGILTILFSRDHFEQIACKFGFQRNQGIDSVNELEIANSKHLPLWSSSSRYSFEPVARGLSINGWKGFYETSYNPMFQTLIEDQDQKYYWSYIAFARKILSNGKYVYVIFTSRDMDDKLVYQTILSTLHIYTK